MRLFLKTFLINILALLILSNCRGNFSLNEPVVLVSLMEGFDADGNFEEWEEKGRIPLFCNQTGEIPNKLDLNAFFKLAYNRNGLLFYFFIEDDTSYTDTIHPWNGDAVEIFLAPRKGSKELLQISISLLFNDKGIPVIRLEDRRKQTDIIPNIFIYGSRKDGITEMEMQIGLPWLFPIDSSHTTIALQVYVDDSDKKMDKDKNRLTWFNNNYSSETSFSYFPIRFGGEKEYFPESTARIKIIDEDSLIMKIFGMVYGDTLSVFQSSEKGIFKLIEDIVSSDVAATYNLSEFEINYKNDEIYVFQNSQCVSYHDLILAPREYINFKPPKFYDEIRRFLAVDKVAPPAPNSTLFIGSSSIRMWNTLESDFPELEIINRGFGGSNSADVLQYINEIVLPYKAAKIIYYEGDNDIPEGIEIDSIVRNIRSFIEIVLKEKPEAEIYIISPKPAIVRLNYYNKYIELHAKLQIMIEKMEGITFVDVASPMFLSDGSLDNSLFQEDKLHINEKGYRMWTSVLREKMGLCQQ